MGCKLNFSETSSLARELEKEGYVKKEFHEEADTYIINTCSVTENADKECKQLVRRVKKLNPQAKVVITGCYAQLKPEEIASISGVDMVIGTQDKFNLPKRLNELFEGAGSKIHSCDIQEVNGYHSAYSQHDRTRTFMKVQDGCDYTCSFCTIPLARGHSRSDRIENVVANVKEIALGGTQEIVLTGVNLGDFGKGFHGNKKEETFYDLIQELDALPHIPRYRISSIEPNLLSEPIIEFVAQSQHFMPHFHIPLQSGSNSILAAMRRRYKRELYQERVNMIKHHMPHACIGVDVIVGFPGEEEKEFEETYRFLESIDISYLHVFTYSERDHTKALEINPIIPMQVRKERNTMLRHLSEEKMKVFEKKFEGTTRDVLFEKQQHGEFMEGYTDNYIRVTKPYREDWVNTIQKVELP